MDQCRYSWTMVMYLGVAIPVEQRIANLASASAAEDGWLDFWNGDAFRLMNWTIQGHGDRGRDPSRLAVMSRDSRENTK